MPPKSKDGPVISTSRGEVLRFKSPAEFFSENKNIAGFDNPGKSLYTTVRELVENSLDACESINVLPEIDITIEEMDRAALNKLIGRATRLDDDRSCPTRRRREEAAAAAASSAASTPTPTTTPTMQPPARAAAAAARRRRATCSTASW